MSDESLNCLRCGTQLTFLGEKDFHEGSRGWGFFLGDLGELFTAREKVELYACEACGHLEFFLPE
jgi:DNA-directed RNA polymerase subunit RPC12/RpoP